MTASAVTIEFSEGIAASPGGHPSKLACFGRSQVKPHRSHARASKLWHFLRRWRRRWECLTEDGVDRSLSVHVLSENSQSPLDSSSRSRGKKWNLRLPSILCSLRLYHACCFGVVAPLNSPVLPPVPTNHVAKTLLTSSVGRQPRATFSCR